MTERIYDVRHDYDPDHVLHVDVDEAGTLTLTAIDGDEHATIKIGAAGAKALRLAVQRFERRLT